MSWRRRRTVRRKVRESDAWRRTCREVRMNMKMTVNCTWDDKTQQKGRRRRDDIEAKEGTRASRRESTISKEMYTNQTLTPPSTLRVISNKL